MKKLKLSIIFQLKNASYPVAIVITLNIRTDRHEQTVLTHDQMPKTVASNQDLH